MSFASDHRTDEQESKLKARFDRLRRRTCGRSRRTCGRSRRYFMGSPMNGKNKAQRRRLQDAFNLFLPSKGPVRFPSFG
jgi:hypothetical protein